MADELISRQAAMDNLKKSLAFSENELDIGEFRRGCIAAIRDAIGNIKHLPSVDAVEVVRCKDCIRRYDLSECPMHFLSEDGYSDYTADDGYCDRGERRGRK